MSHEPAAPAPDPAPRPRDAPGSTTPRGTDDAAQPPVVPQLTEKQAKRINAPVRGMLISMAVLMLLVLPFVWLSPKPDAQPYRADVDVAQEAHFVAEQADFTPAAPQLGDDWSANYARWNATPQDGVAVWNVGLLSPDLHLLDLAQTARSNPTWLAQRTELIPQTDERDVAGVRWRIHHRDPSGKQEEFTAWVGTLQDSTVVLSGKATAAEFEHVAAALSARQ